MPSSSHDDTTDRTTAGSGRRAVRRPRRTRRSPAARVLALLRQVAFWTAVFLPFAVGATVLGGLGSRADWRLFGLLAVTSVVALYLGHPYTGG